MGISRENRRLVRKVLLVGLGSALVMLLSAWIFSWFYTWRPGIGFHKPQVMLGYGKVVYTVPGDVLIIVGPLADELEYNGFSGNIFDWPHANSRIGLEMPYYRIDSARGDIYSLPLWLPNLLTAVMLSFLVVRAKKHARQSTTICLNCEYNLTGNKSGTCPECGTAIVPPTNAEVVG